jgi:hypothetical protein
MRYSFLFHGRAVHETRCPARQLIRSSRVDLAPVIATISGAQVTVSTETRKDCENVILNGLSICSYIYHS